MESQIIYGDCLEKLKELPDAIADCCVTSPPYYGLRDYGTAQWIGGDPNCPHKGKPFAIRANINANWNGGNDVKNKKIYEPFKKVCPLCGAVREDKQIGLEESPEEYVQKLVAVFREVKRVLKDDGTLWLNIGDSYAGGQGRWGGLNKLSGKQNTNVGSLGQIPKYSRWEHDVIKQKDLIGIPWMLAFALRADGWYLRQDIIWAKPNPMPESVKDRCVKSHEYIFLLSKQKKYYFDYEAIQEEAKWKDDKRATQGRIAYDGKRTEGTDKHAQQSFVAFSRKKKSDSNGISFGGQKYGDNADKHFRTYSGKEWTPQTKYKNLEYNGQQNHTMHERRAEGLPDEEYVVRNKRDVWSVSVQPIREAHFATFPEKLIEPCILAGSRVGGLVIDPFFGSGTTGLVASKLNRFYIGIELNPEYIEIGKDRNSNVQMTLTGLI